MIERFLTQTHFSSEEDYRRNLHFKIPENFNFAYDVMDVWAEEQPDKTAMIWTDDEDHERIFTYKEMKLLSDRTAAYFASLGIGHGDMVMLILKRRYEWWLAMLALHKLGAVAIPATHMLTKHDIIYRNNRAGVKAIVCVGEEYVLTQVSEAMPESPTVETLISVGPDVPAGFHDWHAEWEHAPAFVRPGHVNSNGDTMLMYFTSGTSGEPKMVAHDSSTPSDISSPERSGTTSLKTAYTSLWQTRDGERRCGASSTDSGSPERRCSCSTTRSSPPTNCCAR